MARPTKKRTDAAPNLVKSDGYELTATPTTETPPIDPRRVVTSDLTVSHVASSIETAWFQTDRALSMHVDDVERQFGIQAYERAVRIEPTIAGIIFTTKALTIGSGCSVGTACEEPPPFRATLKQKNDWEQAQRFRDYGQELIGRLDVTDDNILITIADQINAAYRGHTLAEKELNYFPSGDFKGKYCLQSLRVKPRENYTFVLDEMNRKRGITAKIPGVSMLVWQGVIGDSSYLNNVVAMEKFVVLTCDQQYGRPEGVSMMRALWDPYTRLQKHIKPDMIRTGHQFGGGMITVIGPVDFRDINVVDPDTGELVNIMVAIKRQAQKLGSGGVAVFPNGCTVQVHYPTGKADVFNTMYDRCVQEMYQRWFGSAEAFVTVGPNSEANAGTAQDTVDAAIKHFQRWISTAYTTQLFQPLVRRSFGDEFVKYAPTLILNPQNDVDWAVDMTAVSAYAESPAWDDSQAIYTDKKLGISRDPNWIANKQKREADAAKAAVKKRPQGEPSDDPEEEAA